jgi:hypothetical protein
MGWRPLPNASSKPTNAMHEDRHLNPKGPGHEDHPLRIPYRSVEPVEALDYEGTSTYFHRGKRRQADLAFAVDSKQRQKGRMGGLIGARGGDALKRRGGRP